jgi:Ni2+-binding GTPase involved in maturation of urease and hydrogenase
MNEKKFKVEIVERGHLTVNLTLEEIRELEREGNLIVIENDGNLQALNELSEEILERANRILAFRHIRGG